MTKDRLKEEIGLFKLLMTIGSAIFTSVASWLWNNYSTTSIEAKIIIIITLTIFLVTVVLLFIKIDQKIKELDYYD